MLHRRAGPSGSLGTVVQQRPSLDPQTASYPSDVVDRNVPLRPLNTAKISAIDPGLVSQRLLAQTTLRPKATHVPRQDVPKRPLVSLFHKVDFGPITLLRRPLLSYNPYTGDLKMDRL